MNKEGIAVENDIEVIYRYKYLPFNEGSLKMIADGTLKFTCPLDFNDPFDCMPAFDPKSIESICEIRPDLIKKAGKELGYSPAKRIENKWRFRNNVKTAIASGEFVKSIVRRMGIFCVSRTPCSPLMWSHYADSHKGFVVELRIAMDSPRELIQQIIPSRVEYKKIRPIINWATPDEYELEKYFFTKSEDWSYEQEERTISLDRVAGIYPYSRNDFLCSVIAGTKIEEVNYERLKNEIEKASKVLGKKIQLRKAQLARNAYKIFIPGHLNQDFNGSESNE
ncbi:DUF2971 domain-containing protein [Niveibacterium terrae]|uniref:DUF2971 domain-containing protein n=1 Tax=Niveibacterium terrae TaxID=3373598 RepID=UPI003A90B07D